MFGHDTFKQLQVSAAGARQKYLAHLEDQRKQKAEQAGWKRKLVSDEVEQLKKKQKLCISNDIAAMIKSADDYADKAEKLHDLAYMAKSNSLRWAAKDKDDELKSVSDQLEAASLRLKLLN